MSVLINLEDSLVRIKDKLIRNTALPNIPNWIAEKTFLKGKPFSFKDHEFQVAIASDTRQRVVTMKPSQVGLSELTVRFILAFLCIKVGLTAIYVLPNRGFAMKFSKGRIDPVISGSPEIKRRMVAGVDGSELKQIGESFLYVGGANTDSQAISIPGDLLVRDEYDFGDPSVLGKYNSRLRHAEGGGLVRDFSTPTVEGYGISLAFASSTQAHYMCKCKACNHWQVPDFHNLVRIPKFDRPFADFSPLDLPTYDYKNATVNCEKCGVDLLESLSDPENRQWVQKHPSREVSGYGVSPLDVVKYNTPDKIIAQLLDYDTRTDYENFVLGRTFSDDTTEVNIGTVKACTEGYDAKSATNTVLGIDVGNTLFVTVGRLVDGRPSAIARMQVNTKHSDPLVEIDKIVKVYGVNLIVMDANPDLSLVRNLVAKYNGVIPVYPANYVEDSKRDLKLVNINNEGIASIKRTKAFDELVRSINGGFWKFTLGPDTPLFHQHLKGMKRVSSKNDKGEQIPRWVKLTDNDHYFHSLLYCSIALSISESVVEENFIEIPFVDLRVASIGSSLSGAKTNEPSARELTKILGV